MGVVLRPIARRDAEPCGRVVDEAFRDISERHGFPPAFPSAEAATRVVRLFIDLPAIWGRVAERAGEIVGAIFVDEGDPIRGVALVAVAPGAQGGPGRLLMEAALERARGARGVRLVQEAFNLRSLALYASLGFEAKEPLVQVKGMPRSADDPGLDVHPLTRAQLGEAGDLYTRVHGHTRTADLTDAFELFTPFGVVRDGRVTAVTYVLFGGTLAWGVAETENDMRALLTGIGGGIRLPLSFHVPVRQASFLRWCLDEGLRIEKPLALMAMGEWQEPAGCWFPSGIY
jgi:GNAT superfamily N-acetyltransferase